MENNICPMCGKEMNYDIQLDYDHSPYHCECGYAEGCREFNQKSCCKCTEYGYCLKWYEVKNNIKSEPICYMCGKKASELQEYIDAIEENNGYKTPSEYVRAEEGTYNRKNNTFVCTHCYVKYGF